MAVNNPHIHKQDDGSIMIEWIFTTSRFFISLEPGEPDCWGYVTLEDMQGGELPEEIEIHVPILEE